MHILFYTLIFFYLINIFYYYYKKIFNNNFNLLAYLIKKFLYYLDYKVEPFDINVFPSKMIVISSHTSIYDFIIGTLFYYGYLHERYNSYVLMKYQFEVICSPIIQYFDKKFKLISIKKNEEINVKKGVTHQIYNKLKDKDNFIIFIAPEGTRKCTDKLRSGYWVIAHKLDIDILYIGIDFLNKNIFLENPRKAKNTWENEQEEFIISCKKYIPLYPERCYWTKDFYINN